MIDRFKYIIFPLFVCLVWAVSAQSPAEVYLEEDLQKRVPASAWNEITEGLDYSAQKPKKKPKEEEASGDRYEGVRDRGESSAVNPALIDAILVFLSVVAVAVIIGLLLKHLLGIEILPRDKKIGNRAAVGTLRLEDIEQNIHESDLDRFIREALQEKQYALAIRLYYLAILKELSLAKVIRWKRDKTNRQYLQEIKSTALSDSFAEATQIFEWAWYGSHQLTAKDYARLAPKFKAIVEQVRTHL